MEEYTDQTMGIFGMPGTFPTQKVLEGILKSDPDQVASRWTRTKVNDMWYWYSQGLKKGYEPWEMQNRGIATYISENTNFSDSDANMFGFNLWSLVKEGKISNEWHTGTVPSTQPQLSNIIPNTDSLMTYAKTVKWVAILGVVGIGVYFAWPALMAGRKQLKKRTAKHG